MLSQLIKQYLQELKQEVNTLISTIKKVLVVLAIKRLKRKALRLHKKHNCQVFVVKLNGKITVLSKYQFTQLRQRGKIKKSFTAQELKRIALYYTPAKHDKKGVQGAARAVQAAKRRN